MKRKNIDAMREVRLWTGQIIIPGIIAGVFLMQNENSRKWVGEKKDFVVNKFKRK